MSPEPGHPAPPSSPPLSPPSPRPAKPGRGKKVVVAMSGGVDSSAAAALLKEDGYEVVGCFMRLGSTDEAEVQAGGDNLHAACDSGPGASGKSSGGKQGCCSVNDAHDAALVAAQLDIPFYVLNFKKDFGRIMDYFVAEYNAGRTPNPCVRCNDWLKFGRLHDYAKSIDADFIASGHYARVRHDGPRPRLLRGVDHAKDQSYVLFGAGAEQLEHMLLPIGHLEKSVTRQIAQAAGLPTFNKPDSQEICFVPDNDYAALVERRTAGGFLAGEILNTDGQRIGEHPGHQHYTHGQRRRIGVALGHPIYVVDKDPVANTITVGGKADLMASGCVASQANWLIGPPPPEVFPEVSLESSPEAPRETFLEGNGLACRAKVRYNSEPTPARVWAVGPDQIHVRFNDPLEAVTPGQAVVCYGVIGSDREDDVLCGGWIDTAVRAEN